MLSASGAADEAEPPPPLLNIEQAASDRNDRTIPVRTVLVMSRSRCRAIDVTLLFPEALDGLADDPLCARRVPGVEPRRRLLLAVRVDRRERRPEQRRLDLRVGGARRAGQLGGARDRAVEQLGGRD